MKLFLFDFFEIRYHFVLNFGSSKWNQPEGLAAMKLEIESVQIIRDFDTLEARSNRCLSSTHLVTWCVSHIDHCSVNSTGCHLLGCSSTFSGGCRWISSAFDYKRHNNYYNAGDLLLPILAVACLWSPMVRRLVVILQRLIKNDHAIHCIQWLELQPREERNSSIEESSSKRLRRLHCFFGVV